MRSVCGRVLPRRRFVRFLQPLAQLGREFVETLLADGLQIKLVELRLLRHLGVADGTGKVVDAPRFVQSSEH